MPTENIGGIDVVIQAHDAQYTAAMRRAAMLARQTGQQIRQAFAPANMIGGLQQFGAQADRIFSGLAGRARLLGRDLRSIQGTAMGALGGLAGVFSGRAFLDQAGGFEQQMDILRAISGATTDQLGELEQQALALGRATARSANDIAGAQLELTKMGFTMSEIIALTPAVTNFSIAADMDLSTAAHTGGAIMRQFRMEATDMTNIMDVMMRGANESAADVSDFAGSLRYAGAMAAAANMDLETTVALLAAASDAGMEGFMAGTSLRSLVGDFNTPTPMAAQMFRQFNIELRDSDGQLRNIIDLIEEVNTRVPASLIGPPLFEVDSSNLLNALRGMGADSLRDRVTDVRLNQTGEAARSAEARMEGLKGAVETLGGAFETLLIRIGESGFLKAATDVTRAITFWVEGLSEARLGTIAFAGAVVAAAVALGPLLFAVGAVLTLLTSPEGLIFGLAAAAAGFHVWTQISAEIRGVQAALAATQGPVDRIAQLNAEIANSTHDAAAGLRDQRTELTALLLMEAQRSDAMADQAEAERQRERSTFMNRTLWGTGFFADMGETARAALSGDPTAMERAIELRSRADQAAAIYDRVFQGNVATDNPRPGDSRPPRPDMPVVPHIQRFMGYTPGESIARETEQLRRLSVAANDGVRAMEELALAIQLQEQSRNPMTGAIEMSEDRAREIVRERRALQRNIDMQQLRHETALTTAEQLRLSEAAGQGARAYERMSFAAQLMREIPLLTAEEAQAMAAGLQTSNEQLDRAVGQMQRWQQTFEAIGDRVASAFEEAIVNGGSLGDVLKSLARDMLMLVLRAAILEPMAQSIGRGLRDMFGGTGSGQAANGNSGGGGFDWGSVLSAIGSLFGGFFADGGQLAGGKWGIVGERGPELIRGGAHGATIVPLTANSNRPGGMMVDARAYIDATGADKAAIARLEAGLRERDRALPGRIQATVGNMNSRGRAWS